MPEEQSMNDNKTGSAGEITPAQSEPTPVDPVSEDTTIAEPIVVALEPSSTPESNGISETVSASEIIESAHVPDAVAGAMIEGDITSEEQPVLGHAPAALSADAEGAAEATEKAPRPPRQLSKRELLGADFLAKWKELQDAQRERKMVDMRVVRKIKGGVVLDFKGLDVFMPFSHWSLSHIVNEVEIDGMLGHSIPVRVIEVSAPEKSRVIASRRKLMVEEKCATMEPGKELKGRISGVTSFGIFVDLDGVEGLVHASHFAHTKLHSSVESARVGDEIDVVVQKLDPKRARVWLNLKDHSAEMWNDIPAKYPVGSIHPAKIVAMKKFGMFVELEPMVEAFINTHELSWSKRIRFPEQLFRVGDEGDVKIIKIKDASHKLEASIKQVKEDPWPALAATYGKGAFCEGKVKQVVEKGVVVELAEGVEGFVPRSKMIPREGGEPPVVAVGDTMQLRVVDFSAEEQFIILGIKYEPVAGSRGPRRDDRPGGRGGDRGGDRRERRDDRGPRFDMPQRTGERPTLGELISEKIRRKLQGSK